MIDIEVAVDVNGILRACKATGHANAGKAGNDIVCAAVTVLMRTALSTLSNRKGILLRDSAPEEGQLWLETDYNEEGRDFLFCAGEFLINGLSSVAQEYPQNCKITIKNLGV